MNNLEQRAEQRRVRADIATHILTFLRGLRDDQAGIEGSEGTRPQFYKYELVEHVRDNADGEVAPNSPTRILQLLKKEGTVDYDVIRTGNNEGRGALYELVSA